MYNKNNINFNKNPNLIYEKSIIKKRNFRGCKFFGNLGYNDLFDIYTPFNEENKNKIYLLAKSDSYGANIDIIDIEDNDIINQLCNGHQNNKLITMIRHFGNPMTKIDYLISSSNKEIIVWNLNLFNIVHSIKSNNEQLSYSSVLLFNTYHKLYSNLIIISYSNKNSGEKDFIKVYNFDNGEFIKVLPDLSSITCFYLLIWENSENENDNDHDNNIYVIACCNNKIIIYNIFSNDNEKLVHSVLKDNDNKIIDYYSACLLTKKSEKNEDYLYSNSNIDKIFVWNLNMMNLAFVIDVKFEINNFILYNEKYLLVGDISGSLLIVDINQNKIISKMKSKETFGIKCIKKFINHNNKEFLLTYDINDSIELWTVK